MGLHDIGRQREIDRDLLAVGPEQVDRGRLLIARVVTPQVVALAPRRPDRVAAYPIDREIDHVHPHRIAGREHKPGEHPAP